MAEVLQFAMKKITYFVQRFRPAMEATSKEVNTLFRFFDGKIHDLHLDSYFKIIFKKDFFSYHFIFYPLLFPIICLLNKKRILHVFTGLGDSVYLPFLPKKQMLLTSTNFFSRYKIRKRYKHLKKVKKIVVESEVQKKELLAAEVSESKIELIYPSVDLKKFSYQKAAGEFKILNASCPTKKKDFKRRGISLLFAVDKRLDDCGVELHLMWRHGFDWFRKIIINRKTKGLGLQSIKVSPGIIKDMNEVFSQYHCTIIPYTRLDEYLKLVPLTVLESLAAGKPVLISSRTGITNLIKKEKCGVVFEPEPESLIKAVKEIKKNYRKYQKNCRKTAERYFSEKLFIKGYGKIYSEILP